MVVWKGLCQWMFYAKKIPWWLWIMLCRNEMKRKLRVRTSTTSQRPMLMVIKLYLSLLDKETTRWSTFVFVAGASVRVWGLVPLEREFVSLCRGSCLIVNWLLITEINFWCHNIYVGVIRVWVPHALFYYSQVPKRVSPNLFLFWYWCATAFVKVLHDFLSREMIFPHLGVCN